MTSTNRHQDLWSKLMEKLEIGGLPGFEKDLYADY